MSDKSKRINLKFEDYSHCDEIQEDCFLKAIDEAIEEGKRVSAIIKKDEWTSNTYLQRWTLRKDCRIVIQN